MGIDDCYGNTTGKHVVADWKKMDMDKAGFCIQVAAIIRTPATETAIMMARLEEAGLEIRPIAGGL
jgi:hypothetical protein